MWNKYVITRQGYKKCVAVSGRKTFESRSFHLQFHETNLLNNTFFQLCNSVDFLTATGKEQ